jgi:ubiquinone/menaquinone biosynthesis C-methylase UbiE
MQTLGNFEKLAQAYQSGRRGFDNEVFDFLSQQINSFEGKKILDVGCGTGIATRQLKQYGAEVVGSDLSEGMIVKAKLEKDGIEYVVAPSNKLPFTDESFDLVTAFSAFHWFTDSNSVKEIKRVLKNQGSFVVINKNDIAGIRKDVNKLFTKYRNTKSVKEEYNPEQILEKAGFIEIATHTVVGTELFTPEQALTYLQSISLWNLVPEQEKEEVLTRVKSFCDKTLKQEGVLKRELETVVTVGIKK